MLQSTKGKVHLGKPGKDKSKANCEINNKESKGDFKPGQNTASFESMECTTLVPGQEETVDQRENDVDCCDKTETNTVYDISDVTEGLKVKQKKTKRKAVGVRENHARKMDKNPYEKITSKANSTSVSSGEKGKVNGCKGNTKQSDNSHAHENSITNSLKGSETIQTTATLNENAMTEIQSSSDAVRNITATETNCDYHTAQQRHNEVKQNYIVSETSDLNSNQQPDANSVLDNQANIPEKVGHGFTHSSKRHSKSASSLTPVAWEDSPRKSIETGLASARNTGLIIIQTSSVCVMIPQATDRRRSPVNEIRRRCAALIMNPMFDWFVTSVIFLNTVVMATEYHGMNQRLESTLDNINLVSSTCLLRISPNCGSYRKFVSPPLPQTSMTTPTHFCMFTILILNSQSTFNCSCYQEPDWLFKIRIVNMQNYVGAVVDACGSGRLRIFDAIPQFGDFRNNLWTIPSG
jgi:hypothetical protein